MAYRGAEGAKFKRLRGRGAMCHSVGRVRESGEQRAHAHE